MKAVQIFSNKNLVMSKTLLMFAVRTSYRFTESQLYIQAVAFNKATPLRQFYFGSLDWFAKLQGGVASFAIYIHQIFSQMRTSKNLQATAPGASASTPNTRKRVTSIVGITQPAKFYYKVSLHLIPAVSITGCSCGCYVTNNYPALSEAEAIGIALQSVHKEFPFFRVVADRINVSKTQFTIL